MSTNKTPNYQLSQWLATDPIRMSDFNADNQIIDAALAGMIKFHAGSYTGNGGTSVSTTAKTQTIPLPFSAKMVFIYPADGICYVNTGTYGYHFVYGGMAAAGQPGSVSGRTAVEIVENGFTVNFQCKTASLGTYSSEDCPALNYGGKVYNYIALG